MITCIVRSQGSQLHTNESFRMALPRPGIKPSTSCFCCKRPTTCSIGAGNSLHYLWPGTLERAAAGLLALDGLEQRLEVAGAKASRPLALDDLEEDGGPVRDHLGKHLEQVAILVAVDQDPEPPQLVPREVEVAEAGPNVVVIRGRHVEEAHAPLAQRPDRRH